MTDSKKLVLLDVGGVIRDTSISFDKGFKKGFESEGIEYKFNYRDIWNLMGLNGYNHVNQATAALYCLAIDGREDELHSILRMSNAPDLLDKILMEKGINENSKEVKTIYKISLDYFHSNESKGDVRIFDNINNSLKNFKNKDFTIGIFSNSSRRTLDRDLVNIDKSYLSIIMGSEDVERAKPYGDGIIKAMNILKIPPTNTYYVGDSVTDIMAARDAKCKSVAVLSGMGLRLHLEKEKPDYIFNDLYEASIKLN